MSADRTPAPVAVPEGGWQDCGERHPTNPSVTPCCLEPGHEPDDHWSTTGCAGSEVRWPVTPRPEPVVAPLPTEAAEGAADVLASILEDWLSEHLSWRDGDSDGSDHWIEAPVVQVADAVIAAGYRLVPEDDEDTVRVPREALTYAATALEGSHDNGDRYCAAQIRAALGGNR